MESRQCKISALFGAALRLHPGCFQPQNKTDLPLWVCGQTGLVFPLVPSREHSLLSIRGAAGGFGFCVLPGVAPPFWGERQRRWGDDNTPHGEYPEGDTPLGDSLVTFSSGRKSPGCRAWQGHALAERLHIVGCRGYQPLQRTSAIGQNDRTAPPPAAGQSVPRSSR